MVSRQVSIAMLRLPQFGFNCCYFCSLLCLSGGARSGVLSARWKSSSAMLALERSLSPDADNFTKQSVDLKPACKAALCILFQFRQKYILGEIRQWPFGLPKGNTGYYAVMSLSCCEAAVATKSLSCFVSISNIARQVTRLCNWALHMGGNDCTGVMLLFCLVLARTRLVSDFKSC